MLRVWVEFECGNPIGLKSRAAVFLWGCDEAKRKAQPLDRSPNNPRPFFYFCAAFRQLKLPTGVCVCAGADLQNAWRVRAPWGTVLNPPSHSRGG